MLEPDLQAVGKQSLEEGGLNPLVRRGVNRPKGEVGLEFLEGLLDLSQLAIPRPELSRVLAGEMGAPQITALPAAPGAQLVAPELEGEGGRGDRLSRFRELARHPAQGAAGLLSRTELEHQLIATEPLEPAAPPGALLLASTLAASDLHRVADLRPGLREEGALERGKA
jgi:hypothetical protein